MKPSSLVEFYNLLNLIEDYFQYGFRQEHPPFALSDEAPEEQIERISRQIAQCKKCDLHLSRTHTVAGEGVLNPDVMIIGEGPGGDEDRIGRPFIGKAGHYLDTWLKAVNLNRFKNCFISNIVKCRPPKNRDPEIAESSACLPYLERQIDLLKPRIILTLGRISSQILTGETAGIGSLHGRLFTYRNIPLLPTYHPSAVLRNQSLRSAVWEDLKILRSVLDDA